MLTSTETLSGSISRWRKQSPTFVDPLQELSSSLLNTSISGKSEPEPAYIRALQDIRENTKIVEKGSALSIQDKLKVLNRSGILTSSTFTQYIPAVRCFTCGAVVGNKFLPFLAHRLFGASEGEALDVVNVTSECCRINVMNPQVFSGLPNRPIPGIKAMDRTTVRSVSREQMARKTAIPKIVSSRSALSDIKSTEMEIDTGFFPPPDAEEFAPVVTKRRRVEETEPISVETSTLEQTPSFAPRLVGASTEFVPDYMKIDQTAEDSVLSQPTPSFQPQPTPSFQPQPTPSFQPQPTPSFQPQPTPSFQPQPTPSFQPQQTSSVQPQSTPTFQPTAQPILSESAVASVLFQEAQPQIAQTQRSRRQPRRRRGRAAVAPTSFQANQEST